MNKSNVLVSILLLSILSTQAFGLSSKKSKIDIHVGKVTYNNRGVSHIFNTGDYFKIKKKWGKVTLTLNDFSEIKFKKNGKVFSRLSQSECAKLNHIYEKATWIAKNIEVSGHEHHLEIFQCEIMGANLPNFLLIKIKDVNSADNKYHNGIIHAEGNP